MSVVSCARIDNHDRSRVRVFHGLLLLVVTFFSASSVSADTGEYGDLIQEYFSEEQISSYMVNQLGRGVISLLHPTSSHSSTTITSNDGETVRFRTEYEGWVNEHTMIWEVELSPNTLISDFEFISDTSPIPSGMAANYVKNQLVSIFNRVLD